MTPIWYCPLCYAEGVDPSVLHCPEDGSAVCLISDREAKWIGKVIDNKYKITSFIGAGGMADVFEVERMSSDKRLALKLMKSVFTRDKQLHERFRQEAMLISLIAHRNIVALEDFGILEDKANYMVMELLTGYSLGEALNIGPIPPASAFQISLQACEGMAAAHERGVIHRDLKPDNIFVHTANDNGDDFPIIKILDLGIGKLFTNNAAKGLTLSGTLVGTPQYMSPEQCKGEQSNVASDIYSMGIVLYEMLFGFVPFDDNSQLLILPKHISDPPHWDAALAKEFGIPQEAKKVVLRALEKNPYDRYESMLELQKDIAALLSRLRHGRRYSLPAIEEVRNRNSRPPRKSFSVGAASTPTMPAVSTSSPTMTESTTKEIFPNIYWVGRHNAIQLECNVYLRIFQGNDHEVSLLIDPGPLRDFHAVSQNIASIIGSIDNLNYIFLNHQDPDVAGNAAEIQRINPRVHIICSEDTWRLARDYGLDPKRYISTESIPGGAITFNTGHTIQFVPTPFCHARGAVMVYDLATTVLFSGDLFGGTSSSNKLDFGEQSLRAISLFHQIYMPSRRALTDAIDTVFALQPSPQLIAPQHGAMISIPHMTHVLNIMKNMVVGMELIDANREDKESLVLANRILQAFCDTVGSKPARELIQQFSHKQNLISMFDIQAPLKIVQFRVDATTAIDTLLHEVMKMTPPEQKNKLKRAIAIPRRSNPSISNSMPPFATPARSRNPMR